MIITSDRVRNVQSELHHNQMCTIWVAPQSDVYNLSCTTIRCVQSELHHNQMCTIWVTPNQMCTIWVALQSDVYNLSCTTIRCVQSELHPIRCVHSELHHNQMCTIWVTVILSEKWKINNITVDSRYLEFDGTMEKIWVNRSSTQEELRRYRKCSLFNNSSEILKS